MSDCKVYYSQTLFKILSYGQSTKQVKKQRTAAPAPHFFSFVFFFFLNFALQLWGVSCSIPFYYWFIFLIKLFCRKWKNQALWSLKTRSYPGFVLEIESQFEAINCTLDSSPWWAYRQCHSGLNLDFLASFNPWANN